MQIFEAIEIHRKPQALHSGGETNIIINIMRPIADPVTRAEVLKHLDTEAGLNPATAYPKTVFVGLELGGAVLAAMLAYRHNCGFGIVRKDGTVVLDFEHRQNPGDYSFILVDDVRTTGESLFKAKKLLESSYSIQATELYVVDRSELEYD